MNRKHAIITEALPHRPSSYTLYIITLLLAALMLGACRDSGRTTPSEPNQPEKPRTTEVREINLFDGKTLGQWKITDFGGQGKVYVKDGSIFLERGNDMTGVTWSGPLFRSDYEISLEAQRVDGYDFFCGLTFPVDTNSCSLILGGWGGSVCGLSSLDFYDASENETTRLIDFKTGQWYKVRLRVIPDKIQAWLDDENIVDVNTAGRYIDIRPEVELAKPLGISTWCTTGAIRNIRMRKLPQKP